MSKPSHLDLGPYRHSVEWPFMKDEEGGDFQHGRIRINSRSPRPYQQVTLFHEWLHGLFDQAEVDLSPMDLVARALGLVAHDEDGLEEMIVRRLAPILVDSMRRNREVLDWILDAA